MIECLVALAIIGVLLLAIPTTFGSFPEKQTIDLAVQTTVQSLRRAQIRAQAVEGDQTWGVFVQNGSVTIFRGSSYLTRDVPFDEIMLIAPSVDLGGLSEVVYDKMTGEPQSTGTMMFETAHEAQNITLFEKGALLYE